MNTSEEMAALARRRVRNNRIFIAIVLLGILMLALGTIQSAKVYKSENPYIGEDYSDYYIEKMDAYLEREAELIEEYELEMSGSLVGDKRERVLIELLSLEYQKFNFFRQNYSAPRGFTLFQADSYNHTVFGYRAINGIIEHRYDDDRTEYDEHKKIFFEFIEKAPVLRNRFTEAVNVYEISKQKKEEAPMDSLEMELEKNSLE